MMGSLYVHDIDKWKRAIANVQELEGDAGVISVKDAVVLPPKKTRTMSRTMVCIKVVSARPTTHS